MLKKRLVGVITVRRGWAVQSFGYRRYLPLGTAASLAENLDRWGVDEIMVSCIDRTRGNAGPDLELLRALGSLGLSTPLTYGGGIRTAEDAVAAIQAGAERVCVDALLRADPAAVAEISARAGAQAVVGALPLNRGASGLEWLDYRSGERVPLSAADLTLFSQRVVSEALLIDWRNEGCAQGFDVELVRRFPLTEVPLIVFGGVSEPGQLDVLLSEARVVAVGIGNFLSYREHAVQKLRQRTAVTMMRGPVFGAGG